MPTRRTGEARSEPHAEIAALARAATPDAILALQRTAGNGAVGRLVARQAPSAVVQQEVDVEEPPSPGAEKLDDYATLPADVQGKVASGTYRDLVANAKDGPGVRVTLVGSCKLLSRQGAAWTSIGRVDWVGTGNMLVWVPSSDDYKRTLEGQGFESKWLASGGADLWGLRKTVDGVGLHIRGKTKNVVEIHFDLHPPKWYALFGLWHVIMDKLFRGVTVTPQSLKTALQLEDQL